MDCKKKILSLKQCIVIVNNAKREECRYYCCNNCNGYHVTSVPQSTINKSILRIKQRRSLKAEKVFKRKY